MSFKYGDQVCFKADIEAEAKAKAKKAKAEKEGRPGSFSLRPVFVWTVNADSAPEGSVSLERKNGSGSKATCQAKASDLVAAKKPKPAE